MRKELQCSLLAGLLVTSIPLNAGSARSDDGWASADALKALSGTYISPAAEEWYGGFGIREFVFDGGRWSLIFTHALDRQMTQRTFQFRTGGSYAIGKPSPAVKGAYHGVFNENWKHVTLLTGDPRIAARMGMADCRLTVNLETDISAVGCAAWRPVAVCGQDHDLLALNARGLHFGVRPRDNDMCTPDKTPTALLQPVVAR